MAGLSRVHWVAPVGMILSLLGSLLFALGHHLFYASLAGSSAPTGSYTIAGTDVSQQQLSTAVGTAFGFLVRSCLVVGISVAFFQAFWRAVRISPDGATLSNLDSSYAMLYDLRGFLKPRYVPIASIITPATLSVQSAAIVPPPQKDVKVPKFDFASLDFLAPIPEGPAGFCFDGPSQPVQRVAAAVAAQGQILPISPPEANASWTLDFRAPSLQCHDLRGNEKVDVWTNILDQWGNVSDCHYSYGYLAWTPTPGSSNPFIRQSSNSSKTVLQSEHLDYGVPPSIYVAAIPQMSQFAFIPSNSDTQEKCQFFGSNSLTYTYPVAEDLCLPGLNPPECCGQQAWATNATLLRCDIIPAPLRGSSLNPHPREPVL
ncbi:uncharacterized protein LTR77_000898 [Saxophila tyrrhenica]|uniref:Uncharacterized protein n=1 Tax=Saxophila tyrrhenica TaxID=1690608 RepID=A0AAV9PR88_9PEZI|nr:hypothetical protein LTR77_000898 [Saxophila tyrrhenica]